MLKKWISWSDGNSSFLRAARDGNLSEVLEYLKGSTDINTSNSNGLNALHLASKEGHINIVTELLRRGANVEAATKKGNTALHIASLAGHEEIVKILVQNGAKVNVQSMTGFTPLYMAAQEGHSEVVKFLLDNGASQSLATVDGFTPLAVALQQGHDKVVAVLLEHDTKGKVRLPALHIAAKKDDIGSANLLLQNDHNANSATKSGFTPLHIAAHYGNVNVGTLLIQKGADVNYKAKNNITPLHVASRWGKSNMVTLLLDHEAVIEERTRDGLTPLHCAARSGHENVVDLLLERGAPFSAKTKNGLTPLHMAAQGDHVDCARLLLYHKAPVDDVTVDYLTPLHVAAHCGNVKTAKLLLDRKSDPNARALNGFTPLHIACKKNRIKVVELLLKYGASIEATTESGLTPLHVASFMGHMNISIYLIQHNANPDYPTVRGETALHLAARANQTDIIRILLRNGATVDAKAREQQTPLHIAARLGNVDNVVLLLQHGASPNATTKDLYTPLHIAAKEGHEEVAAALLDQGADHSLTTKKGFTPLHIAAKYGNIKVARLLLLKDADPDVQGKNGLTPLHVATHYNHVNVALLLLDNKASPHAVAKNGYTPLHIAAKKNQMDIATTLLEFGAKPNAESKNGFTPLHLASQEGHTDMVSLLLEHNANVNAKASNGLAPIHLAAQEDKVNVAEVLVKFGSEIDPQTKAGYTPLHTACHFGQTNMVRFLLDHNASVSSTTKLGYTPLHQAAQQGHVMVINLLLKNKASPNAVTNNGQTALSIAQRLGYISVVDTLKTITEVTETLPTNEDKYRVVAPETMQETMLSDSEDEGEDSISIEKGDITSPLDLSFDKDLHKVRNTSEESRVRIVSDIGASMEYPTYLEKGPDYEAEMMYYSGDILSPQEKKGDLFGEDIYARESFRYGRGSMPSYRETLISSEVAMPVESVVYQGELTGSIATDTGSDYKFPPDDSVPISAKQQDYLDHQVMSHTFASHPENRYLNNTMDNSRYSSYSGSSFNTSFDPDNVPVDRTPTYSGFLVSFMVDARGGAMRGSRHSGVRIIIPPRKAYMPTRVTCKLIKREKLSYPPPLNEGEALASRILEMGPVGVKFLGPVIIEVPHFASLRGKEREIVIIRCDDGEKWTEHPMQATEEAVNETLNGSFEGQNASVSSLWKLDQEEELTAKRITRILTTDFPMYFAIVTRIRQENQTIGSEGGMLSSTVVPQVQTIFPEGALTKKIPVGLQAQPIAPELVAKMLGNRVAVSPIVTVEPRRRKFHKPITLTIPVPRAAQKGMINQYGGDAPTLRLLCSISGGTTPAVWEDITASTQLTFVNDCVSFTTTVSARFWLMDCQNVNEASRMATELYQEAVVVPFMAKFVIFAKRHAQEEGKLRMFCMTDDKVDKTLEKQEKFIEVARSRDVEVLQGRPQYVEMAGNLIPVTKSGDQLYVHFRAFRENRLPCTVKVRDLDQEPAARVAFMKEPKVARGEAPQSPICNLNIVLPDVSKSDSMEMTSEEALEVRKRHSLLREHGIVLQDTISRAQMKITDVADTLQGDWVMLAQQLDITMSEINKIKTEYNTVNDQALAMLHLWVEKNGDKASGNALEKALIRISREDVAKKCMYDVVTFEDEMEMAAGRVAMDQSGFDTFKEEVGISRDSSMKRGLSLDVSYDEQDMIKMKRSPESMCLAPSKIPESESAEESGSDADTEKHRLAKVPSEPTPSHGEEAMTKIVVSRRPEAVSPKVEDVAAQQNQEADRKKDAFVTLAEQLDALADQEEQMKQVKTVQEDEKETVSEGMIISKEKGTFSVSSTAQELVRSEPIDKEVVEKDIIDREQISEVMAPCVDISGSRASSTSSISEQEEKEILPRTKTPPPSPTEVVPSGEHVSERSDVVETKDRLTEELVASQHTPRETGQTPATSDLSQEHEAESGVDRSEMTMEEQFEQTTLDERKPVTESSMLEEDSASTEPALMSSSQSRDNNTYSSISSSDFGEQVSSLQSQQLTTQEVLSEEQALTEEDFQRMMSSYENVYDGVQLTPDVNRLSMNASELDIGDRFDTKQLDMHLQPTGRSSSFEQLYQEEIGERPAEESKLAEQSAYPIKPIEDLPSGEQIVVSKEAMVADEEKAEKLSSSSSEVAQVEDVDFQPDAEMRDTSEEKTEETDVEEQFSPLPKTSPASKGALDLRLEDQYFSFTQSPVESPAAEIANEISPAQDLLDVKDMQITVGVSPSEISARAKLGHISEFFGPTVSDDHRLAKGKFEKEKENVPYVSKIEPAAKKTETDVKKVAKISSESHKAAAAPRSDKETPEDKAERLAYVAFDNIGFAGEEAVDHELKLGSSDLPEESSKSKEISPEDLEEKPHHFDFPDVQQEMWQIGIQAFGKTALSEERKMFSSSMKFEEVTHKVSFEKDEEEESSTAVYSESEEPSRSDNGDLKSQSSFQESVEISKTVDGHFESTSEVRTEKTVVTSSKEQVSLSESRSKMYSETKVYHEETDAESQAQPSEIQMAPLFDEKKRKPLAAVVSEPIISHPFDQTTVELMSPEYSSSDSEGFYDRETGKRLPWETVHHFKRQFSDNYLEQQEKQGLVTVQSVDMGIFYRRRSKEYANVKFMEKGIAEDEEQPDQVVFTLDENDSDESAASPSNREEDEIVDDSTEDIKKPHDKMSKEQRATGLSSSADKRNRAEEELSKLHEEMSSEIGTSEFLSTGKSSELVERGASKDSSLHLVGGSSTDSSHKHSSKDAEESSSPSDESDIKEELKESAKSGIIGVVSVESRRAQKELLQESADERDRSLSPSVDSDELSTTYECQAEVQEDVWSEAPSADQPPSSASEKFEAKRESSSKRKPSEDKQTPSVEPLAKGADIESMEQEEGKITAHDRRVTFLSEESKEKLRQSLSNEDLVKISTSSSEISNEPTLLAASYDLDSGRVSHIVTAYDMSPDTVERQAPHPPAPKAILSSPEDDVFEVEPSVRVTGAAAESHSGPQSEVIIIEDVCAAEGKTGSESTESLPPTPAPTPKDPTAVKDTVCNLQDAANKLQTEGYYDRQSGSVSSETSEKRPLSFDKELTKDEDSNDDIDLGQSFEMVSPTEIIGYDQFAAEYLQSGVAGSIEPGNMAASMDSISTSGSSFADLRPSEPSSMKSSLEESVTTAAFIEPSAPPMEDVYQQSGKQSSKPDVDSSSDQSLFSSSETSERGGVPVDILASSLTSPGACPPDLLPIDSVHHGLPSHHEYGEIEDQESYSERISQLPNGPTEVDYQPDIDSVSSLANTVVHVAPPDLVQTTPLYTREQSHEGEEVEIEDDRISVGSDAASRDVMTDSLIEDVHLSAEQQEILVTSDQTLYELEMPMDEEVSPVEQECAPGETETFFEQKPTISKEMKQSEEEEETDGRVWDSAKALDKQIYDDMSTSSPEHLEIESSLDDIEDQPYELKKDEIYPGKRALEFNVANYENLVEEEMAKQEEIDSKVTVLDPLHFSSKLEPSASDVDDSDEEPVQFADRHHPSDLDSSKFVPEQEYGTTFNRIDIIEDSPDFTEKPEAELQALTEDERPSGRFSDIHKEEESPESKEKPFDLQVDPADLERPISPTPQDLNQGFFGKDFEKATSAQDQELEKTATVFVDSVLEDMVAKVHDKPGSLELGQKSRDTFQSSLPEPSTSSRSQPAFFSAPPPPSRPPPVAKQGSEDLPEITVTEHLHKDIDESDYSLCYAVSHRKASDRMEKDDEKESEDDSPKGVGMSYFEMIQDEMEFDQEDAKQNGDTTHHDASSTYGFSDTLRNGASHQDPITGASFASVSAYTDDEAASSSAEIFTSQQETVWNVQKYSESSTDLSPKTSPKHDSFKIKSDSGTMSTSHPRHAESSADPKDHSKNGFLGFDPAMYVTDIMSPEDLADTSSVDSFTTVVAADQEEDDDEDRLADVASMTSSIHSDIYSMHNEADEEEEPYDWPLMTEEDKSGESSPCSDRFEMIGKTALSVISEKSDEDRFEMIEKDELDGLSDLHSDKTSPDMISASPGNLSHSHHGYPNIRYAGRMREKEDGSAASSVSSSLLEFERLEGEIGQCGSLGSNEAHSLPSSFDQRKFHWRAGDRDDVSVASSLGEFERLERQIALGSSIGSVGSMDRFMASGHGSETNGSMSSLAEFEKLEQDCIAGGYSSSGDDRRSSSSGHSKRSESSSLVEFERLEQEIVISEELAAEAKKIASILESGALPEYPESDSLGSSYQSNGHMRDLPQIIGTFDIEQDSIDGEDIDKDSLSSEDPKQSDANQFDKLDDDADSLDGDSKDELTSSVIYVSKSEIQDSGEAGQTEFDRDSLLGDDTAMQFSVESLQLDQDTSFDMHSMQSSADSLELKEKLAKDMQSSADSLELKEKMNKEMVDSTDSLELKDTAKDPEKFETDSLADPEDVMQTSTDSLDMFPTLTQQNIMEASLESARWSLGSSYFSHSSQETLRSAESHSDSGHSRDMMQVSAESFDFDKDRPYDDSDNEIDYKSISTKSLAHSAIDPEIRMLTEISHPNNPFLDNEGNVRTDLGFSGYGTKFDYSKFDKEGNYRWSTEFDESTPKSKNCLNWGPYQEKKKIYTMTEWEAMRKAKKRPADEESDDNNEEQTSTLPDNHSSHSIKEISSNLPSEHITSPSKTSSAPHHPHSASSSSSSSLPAAATCPVSSSTSQSAASSDPLHHHSMLDTTAHKASRESADTMYMQDEASRMKPEERDDIDVTADSETDDSTQATSLMMKKEIHKKTYIRDGRDETFIQEESRVEQQNETPEELRESMQQIIDQFMQTPSDFDQRQCLEDDV